MTIKHNVSAALTSFITATGTHERAILIGGQAIRDWHAAQTHALTGTAVTLPINPLFPALRSSRQAASGATRQKQIPSNTPRPLGAGDAGGATAPGEGKDAPSLQGWWVDRAGSVWQATETNGLRKFSLQGLDRSGNPKWDYAHVETFPPPAEFKQLKRLRYDAGADVMYLGGTTNEHKNQHWKPMGPVICRYDHWSKPDRKLRWSVVAPYALGSQGHESCEPMGFDVAGDYLFLPYSRPSKQLGFTTGHIEVLKTSDGSSVGHFEPSADIGEIGLQDIRETLTAHRRANGEYLVFLEDDRKAKILLFRWKP